MWDTAKLWQVRLKWFSLFSLFFSCIFQGIQRKNLNSIWQEKETIWERSKKMNILKEVKCVLESVPSHSSSWDSSGASCNHLGGSWATGWKPIHLSFFFSFRLFFDFCLHWTGGQIDMKGGGERGWHAELAPLPRTTAYRTWGTCSTRAPPRFDFWQKFIQEQFWFWLSFKSFINHKCQTFTGSCFVNIKIIISL